MSFSRIQHPVSTHLSTCTSHLSQVCSDWKRMLQLKWHKNNFFSIQTLLYYLVCWSWKKIIISKSISIEIAGWVFHHTWKSQKQFLLGDSKKLVKWWMILARAFLHLFSCLDKIFFLTESNSFRSYYISWGNYSHCFFYYFFYVYTLGLGYFP